LNVSVQNGERLGVEQLRAYLEATDEVRFEGIERAEVYAWISRTLGEQEYWKQAKGTKGLLRGYVQKMTGLSRSQVTRLIAAYLATGTVRERSYRRHRFAKRYTASDIALLAEVDEAHETLSGPATRKILQREFEHYGEQRYERLAGISPAHIYNQSAQEPAVSRKAPAL
jgi:transposase